MGYKIEYTMDSKHKYLPQKNSFRQFFLTLAVFLVFSALVYTYWPEGKALLLDLITPGDPKITWQALEVFANDLRYGEPLPLAAETFCREIMKDAGIP